MVRNRQSQMQKGRKAWNKGIPQSEEMKTRISKSLTGRVKSEITRQKLSDAHKNKIFSDEHIKHLTEARHKRKSTPCKEETKLKISISLKNRNKNKSS